MTGGRRREVGHAPKSHERKGATIPMVDADPFDGLSFFATDMSISPDTASQSWRRSLIHTKMVTPRPPRGDWKAQRTSI